MFRRLVATTPPSPDNPPPPDNPSPLTRRQKTEILFRLHPSELFALLEMAWEFRLWDDDAELGRPNRRSDIPGLPQYLLNLFGNNLFGAEANQENPFTTENRNRFRPFTAIGTAPTSRERLGSVGWNHLIYAYLIENTRIYEIFRKVVYEYRHGEKLGVPLASAQHWLRNTEELFFRDAAPFSIYSVGSYVRPDSGASRRNAYYRMFGMDLNHGMDNGQPYPYIKPDSANREFVNTWEEFLREVWIGISHANNEIGANPTDDSGIADLAKRLHDMLMARRTNGNLSREEFWYVSMMSWFHLTVEFNSSIIVSTRSEAFSEEERLKKIAERVSIPAHGKSYYFFLLADPMSRILTQIETGIFNSSATVEALYAPNSPIRDDMNDIVTYWSQATGHNMKVKTRPVSVQN